jgi:excisionase family DNA binding protein
MKNQPNEDETLLTRQEAADHLNVTLRFVTRCVQERRIRYVRVMKRLRRQQSRRFRISEVPLDQLSNGQRPHVDRHRHIGFEHVTMGLARLHRSSESTPVTCRHFFVNGSWATRTLKYQLPLASL